MEALGEIVPTAEDWISGGDLPAFASELQEALEQITVVFEAAIAVNAEGLANLDPQKRFMVQHRVELLRRNLMLIGRIVPDSYASGPR